jgi:hypothetical protein
MNVRLILSLLCVPLCVKGATITSLSENFDELTEQLAVTSAGAFSTINGTNVDLVSSPAFNLCNGPESGVCADMDGTGGNPQGQLVLNDTFAAGTYLLSFDLIGSQRDVTASVTVTLGNYNQTFVLGPTDFSSGIVTNASVIVSAPGQLEFASNTAGEVGLLLDNVTVTPAVVPEPSTWLLLLLGLTTTFGLRPLLRRRS